MIKIVQIKVIIAVKLLGMAVRFFQVATNKKILRTHLFNIGV